MEKIIATDTKENLVVFDRSGKAVIDLKGSSSSVSVPPETMTMLERGGYRLTHNHPDTGGSFSPADLKTVATTNSLELRAVDDEWTYIVKPKNGQSWSSVESIHVIHQKNIDERMNKFYADLKDQSGLTKSKKVSLWREALHEAMMKTAEDTGIIYIRKRRSK